MTEISAAILNRKGSTTTRGVPAEVLRLLNEGELETVNLSEWLAADLQHLAGRLFTAQGWGQLLPAVDAALKALPSSTAPKRSAAIVSVLSAHFARAQEALSAGQAMAQHRSDIVRGWACSFIGGRKDLALTEKLDFIRPLAADPNMSVREMAWLGVREHLAAELPTTLQLLRPWVQAGDANVRRFASEATRPRGVWCSHITVLKEQPQLALHLLEPLKSDAAKYVRDSVGNWLNDAAKTQPEWVRELCKKWQRDSPSKETAYIVKRALRTVGA
jgi:3-methyladenine DNA glycosylase AlkC